MSQYCKVFYLFLKIFASFFFFPYSFWAIFLFAPNFHINIFFLLYFHEIHQRTNYLLCARVKLSGANQRRYISFISKIFIFRLDLLEPVCFFSLGLDLLSSALCSEKMIRFDFISINELVFITIIWYIKLGIINWVQIIRHFSLLFGSKWQEGTSVSTVSDLP